VGVQEDAALRRRVACRIPVVRDRRLAARGPGHTWQADLGLGAAEGAWMPVGNPVWLDGDGRKLNFSVAVVWF